MSGNLTLDIIAYIHTDFKEKFGIPRQSGRAPSATGRIVFEPKYRDLSALNGIGGFSHLWLIFDFSKAHRNDWSPTVRPPRLGGNKRVGLFASRSPFRPNPLGLSCVRLEKIEHIEDMGYTLLVSGVDLLDMTPIYDIKPYIPYADCKIGALEGYTGENKNYSLKVNISDDIIAVVPEDKRNGLIESLSEDPRPSYHNDKDRIYSMLYNNFDVHFTVSGHELNVISIDIV